ncbi:class A beta-lactamase [Sphingomonas sinipercae]|uniref:beta-lactamase n=1 Tax=Sphingomonas sinipercae TaxID=2714944 RepID=A0A6G7ZKX7_9SPHN|nr:class A beta-lactamase [Sphingomonas sinipercae]QIL01575.1 class A beta-lactamase [Sphingomonas sinipercae]
MTSIWRGLGAALAMAAMAQLGAAAAPVAQKSTPAKSVQDAQPPRVVRQSPQPPAQLERRIDELGKGFAGRVGIAVESIDDGWTTSWNGNELSPQQSVSKLWVSITALDAVDKGKVRLTDAVSFDRSDLTLFHQPIAARVLGGGYTTTLADLMFKAITTSDNTANDKLMRSVGGPDAVRAMIRNKGLGAIRFYNGERSLQSKIAGLTWTQSYSIGRAFYQARDALPLSVRRAAFNRYIEDPYDGASANAIVHALSRLKRGELLSPSSTARLLNIMGNTKTGANRLKGGLRPGWSLSHKTGTGQILGAVQAGYNDIGILTAPDGSSYAVAVMIKKTSVPLPTRMTLMNNVVRAVIAQHERDGGADLAL